VWSSKRVGISNSITGALVSVMKLIAKRENSHVMCKFTTEYSIVNLRKLSYLLQ
jgi:hypothetical protein